MDFSLFPTRPGFRQQPSPAQSDRLGRGGMSHAIAGGDASERGVIPGTGFVPGESLHADGNVSVASQQDGGWHLESPV